jgi:hypothetical protein
MQAYNKTDLYNKYVQQQAAEALQTACISNESYNRILQAYPCKLYTPNYFIRIALGLLTIVAVLFSGLLLWLLSSASGTHAITTLLIFLTVICYITLELIVKSKQYYNAGIDNVLMIMVVVFAVSAFLISDFKTSPLVISSVIMFIALWLSIRFTDAFMGMVSYCCFFIFLFLLYLKAGHIAKTTAPLIMMAVSAVVYFVMKKLIDNKVFTYRYCFKAVTLLTLVTFYVSGNYFIVKELSNQMFHLHLALHDAIPFGWVFWIFTLIIPPAYIIYGIIKKDFLFMRIGLGLIAASIFTVKYYYTILPVEIEMLIAGMILIAVSYALIKYLTLPKHGYTSDNIYQFKKEILNAEALIIAETFNKQPTIQSSGLYGGGSGGGGGATGEY